MAMTYTIERAQTPFDKREQIINVVISRMKQSEMQFSGVRQRLPRLYDLWRGVWTGRFHPHKNNVHIPLIYSAIWADAARKVMTSLASWPLIQFQGYGPNDMPIARKWESLVSAQLKDMDFMLKAVDTFVTADLYGVAVDQLGWRRDRNFRIIESLQTAPISGQLIRTIRKGNVVTFDGPDIEAVDRLDLFVPHGFKRIKQMPYVIRRRYLDLDDVRILVREGIFDQAELDRMMREGGVNAQHATEHAFIKRFQVRTGMDDDTARFQDKYSRPVELLEYWGLIPSELSDDGDTLRVISVANGRYLLRNRPLPFWHKNKPFIEFSPTPDPHYFDAPGKAEVCEKLQIVANKYVNQSLDVADLIVEPVWFYDRAAGLNTKNLYVKPGRFIPVDGNPNDVVSPLQANLGHLAAADQRVDQMTMQIQRGTGIQDDVGQGLEGPARETARGVLARREASGTRLSLESRIYDEGYLEPLCNMIVAINKQFLEAPVEVMILGDSATIDPVTMLPIVDTRAVLSDYDLIQTYAARAMGAMSALSKSMKQQNLIQLLTAMGSPMGQMVMGNINHINFWRNIFREFDIPNINEIFTVNPMLQQLIANTGAQGIGGVPTSGGIAQGAPIPQMNNEGPQEFDLNSFLPPQ